jgi:hypothetical protein
MAQDYYSDCYDGTHIGQEDLQKIEDNFAAIQSKFSGLVAPSNPVALMDWGDLTTHLLKIRNEANSAWLSTYDLANDRYCDDKVKVITGLTACNLKYAHPTAVQCNLTGGITQGYLKTSTGQYVSNVYIVQAGTFEAGFYGYWSGSVSFAMPGGEYGFMPKMYHYISAGTMTSARAESMSQVAIQAAYYAGMGLNWSGTISEDPPYHSYIAYAGTTQRYVTASGEVHWIFILRDKETKKIISLWDCPDHPCFGNGGDPFEIEHPFGNFNPDQQEIIVVNPDLDEYEKITQFEGKKHPEKKHKMGLLEAIEHHFVIDDSSKPKWPKAPVAVDMPKTRRPFYVQDDIVKPIKKPIPKPDCVKARKLTWR